MYLIPQRFDLSIPSNLSCLVRKWLIVSGYARDFLWHPERLHTLVLRSSHLFSGTSEVLGVLETCSNILNDFSCSGTSESPILLRIFRETRRIRDLPWSLRGWDVILWHIGVSNSTPDLQRSHTLVLKSFHPCSQLLRDLVLWHFGVSNHCSGSSKHSHPCSHFLAWQGYTFSSSAHNNSYIYGIHRP